MKPATPESAVTTGTPLVLAPLKRRLACMLYEMLLLIGVLALGFMVPYLVLGGIFHVTPPGWLAVLHSFVLIGAYFVWYWTGSGQTLAMQTWKIRVVKADGTPLSRTLAVKRYCLSWLWLIPAVVVDYFLQTKNSSHLMTLFLFGLFFWPVLALFDRDKQFLHDRLVGTRLVNR